MFLFIKYNFFKIPRKIHKKISSITRIFLKFVFIPLFSLLFITFLNLYYLISYFKSIFEKYLTPEFLYFQLASLKFVKSFNNKKKMWSLFLLYFCSKKSYKWNINLFFWCKENIILTNTLPWKYVTFWKKFNVKICTFIKYLFCKH